MLLFLTQLLCSLIKRDVVYSLKDQISLRLVNLFAFGDDMFAFTRLWHVTASSSHRLALRMCSRSRACRRWVDV